MTFLISRKRETFCLLNNVYFAIFSAFLNLQWLIFWSMEIWVLFRELMISVLHCFVSCERLTGVEMETTWCLDMVCCSWSWLFYTFHTSGRIKKILKRWYAVILKSIEISICWQQMAIFNSPLQISDIIIVTQQYTVCVCVNKYNACYL